MAFDEEAEEDRRRWKKGGGEEAAKLVALGAGLLLAVFLFFKCVVIVPAGSVGVKDFFGKVSDEVLDAGFHLVNPLYTIHKMSVRTEELKETANVPSREGLVVGLEVSLLFSLQKDKAPQVFRTLGPEYVDVVLEPSLRSVVRGVTASYDAKALYTAEREHIANEIMSHLVPVLAERGVLAERVLLRSISLPPILGGAIEKKLEAEQQSEQMKFVLQKESQEAERKRIEAKGISDFQDIVSRNLNDNLLRWKGIQATEKLATSANSKVVVIGAGKGGLPIILGDSKGD